MFMFIHVHACDCSTCPYEWFHYMCVDITRAPKVRWFGSDCSKKQKND